VRILLQRVKKAAVRVNGHLEASTGPGLLALVGIRESDSRAEADYLAEKLVELRIFPDESGKMNLTARDTGAELLLVSQFTLYADCSRGRRPSFDAAARPEKARELYEYFVEKVKEKGLVTRTGVFQAHMDIELVNDGPVTLLIEK
jgi:D-tyrosyl-tRNA(Tyr) deacylase